MDSMLTLSDKQARNLAVQAAIGTCLEMPGNGSDRAGRIVNHLGYVQIDTLQVIERAHHHVLWTRFPEYKTVYLDELMQSKQIFEYWTHALAFVPMPDYRYYLTRMRACYDPYDKWEKDRIKKYGYLLDPIKNILNSDGALTASQIEKSMSVKPDLRSIRSALDMLFFRGEIMISRQDNFQKIYNLTEKVLPDIMNQELPDQDELARFYINRAVQTLGIASEKEINTFLGNVAKDDLSSVLLKMMNAKLLEQCRIENTNGVYYSYPKKLHQIQSQSYGRCFFISPFDPLIIQRDRLKKLFDFDYRLECYVPPAKRVHGYFVLPILWGNQFVGRLDPKVDRKNKVLIIRNLAFEDEFSGNELFREAFVKEMLRFADFHQCPTIILDNMKTNNKFRIDQKSFKQLSDRIELA